MLVLAPALPSFALAFRDPRCSPLLLLLVVVVVSLSSFVRARARPRAVSTRRTSFVVAVVVVLVPMEEMEESGGALESGGGVWSSVVVGPSVDRCRSSSLLSSWIDFKNFLARLATRLVPFRKVVVPFRKFVLERPPVTRDGHISKVGRRCRAWRRPRSRWVVPSSVPVRSPQSLAVPPVRRSCPPVRLACPPVRTFGLSGSAPIRSGVI